MHSITSSTRRSQRRLSAASSSAFLFPELESDNGAVFSRCRTWRYTLWRIWDRSLPSLQVIGLNPSTATETTNDPTVRKCIGFAHRWGFGSLLMTNAFAYRSKNPQVLYTLPDPIGPDNDYWLQEIAQRAGLRLAAWGNHGSLMDRDKQILALIPNLHHLGLTKFDRPKHPLYLPYTTLPVPLGSVSTATN